MKLTYLLVNHLKTPYIDQTPEFSWRIESNVNNVMQTHYRIIVRSQGKTVWDSNTIASTKQGFVLYEGEPLASLQTYRVKVQIRCNNGQTASATSTFRTGFLKRSDWKASWIQSSFPRNETPLFTYGVENPCVNFIQHFELPVTFKRATLFITAYGVYQSFMNEKRISKNEMAPEYSTYDKTLFYQVYDVTSFLSPGENKLSVLVGDGWYFCPQTSVVTDKHIKAPAILFQLEVDLEDGTHVTFSSDGSEQIQPSPIVFSDLFQGEKVDMNRTFTQTYPVIIQDYGYDHLKVQPLPPIRIIEKLSPEKIIISPKGETIVDFGQIISGKMTALIDEPQGTEITFEHTEVLDREGNYFMTMNARQCDTFICDGKKHLWTPAFTFHGFRYVRVSGMRNPSRFRFKALLLSTVKENRGAFMCDDLRFNRLYQNIRYSQKNNMMSIPTDCPTREKAGWTGDILVYAKTAMNNEEMTPFLTSWIHGLKDDQQDDGVIPLVSPFSNIYKFTASNIMKDYGSKKLAGIAGWSDAIVWVPYAMYQVTGNRLILESTYSAMKRWVDYIIQTSKTERGSTLPEDLDQYLWNTGFHFGEWLVPGRTGEGFEICKETAVYIAPIFGYLCISLLSEIAGIINQPEDQRLYSIFASKQKIAIQEMMRQKRFPNHLQGFYVLAFYFDLVPEDLKEEYKARFILLVEQSQGCLGTGFLATPYLLDSLIKLERKDLAIQIFRQNRKPSWLYEVEHGATAIWENWYAMSEDFTPDRTSFDHYAFGVVDSFILERVCGIHKDLPGYEQITINPDFDFGFSWFRRELVTEKGKVIVDYSHGKMKVEIPCNMKARVVWKDKTTELGSGKYVFE